MADVALPLDDKKAFKAWKTNHELHLLLIMKQHNVTKADALVYAYYEGGSVLNQRMG
jgi:hypothetical protein